MDKETAIFLIIYFKVHVIPGEKKNLTHVLNRLSFKYWMPSPTLYPLTQNLETLRPEEEEKPTVLLFSLERHHCRWIPIYSNHMLALLWDS